MNGQCWIYHWVLWKCNYASLFARGGAPTVGTLKQSRLQGWLPHRRRRLKQHVSHLCRYMPCNKIPEFISISHHTARRWDKEILMKTLPAPDLDNIRALLIDEKSIGKGHHYLTVILNADTGETLFLG